jgi:Transposase DNA-binding
MRTAVVRRSGNGVNPSDQDAWIEQELLGSRFGDVRLEKRFRTLLDQLSAGVGESIPLACQEWASPKAADRFLSNVRVREAALLAGHFQSTRDRCVAEPEPVLILHDTTEFTPIVRMVEPLCPGGAAGA